MLALTRDQITIRPASVSEAPDLARLAIMASDGLTKITWNAMRQNGESTLDVGTRRAARSSDGFSYRNSEVVLQNCKVIAAVVSFPLVAHEIEETANDIPAVFRPLIALEKLAIGTWNINILATYPEARGQGAARALIAAVEEQAQTEGYTQLSLIVRDINPARQLYRRVGFRELKRTAMFKTGTALQGRDWVLMIKDLA